MRSFEVGPISRRCCVALGWLSGVGSTLKHLDLGASVGPGEDGACAVVHYLFVEVSERVENTRLKIQAGLISRAADYDPHTGRCIASKGWQ